MCGRITQSQPVDKLIEQFKIQVINQEPKASYNIAPTQQLSVVLEEEAGRVLDRYKWGLVPHWADDVKIGNKMINARAETVAEKPSFKKLLTSRRCIVPADGFYEWREGPDKKKVPFHIHMKDGSVFGFAGLWTEWKPRASDDPPLRTCTIITVAANELMEPIHDRMPAIVSPDEVEAWLNPDVTENEQVLEMLRPFDSKKMEAYRVSTKMNTATFDGPECIQPDHEAPPIEGLTLNSQ